MSEQHTVREWEDAKQKAVKCGATLSYHVYAYHGQSFVVKHPAILHGRTLCYTIEQILGILVGIMAGKSSEEISDIQDAIYAKRLRYEQENRNPTMRIE